MIWIDHFIENFYLNVNLENVYLKEKQNASFESKNINSFNK